MAKRTELTVGQVWAFNRSRQTHIGDWGFEKVTILSTEATVWNRYRREWTKTNKGQGVLVEYTERRCGIESISKKVVQLSQLHMTWDKYEVERAKYESQKSMQELNAKNAKAEKEKYMETIYNPALAELRKIVQDATGINITNYIGKYSYYNELPIEVINFLNEKLSA